MASNIIYTGDADTSKTQVGSNNVKGGNTLLSFQIVATGLNAADAVFKAQYTNDETDDASWIDISGATVTLPSANSSRLLELDPISLGAKYYRFDYDAGANSAGTVKVIVP